MWIHFQIPFNAFKSHSIIFDGVGSVKICGVEVQGVRSAMRVKVEVKG